MFLNEQSYVTINGVPQYISIRAEKEHAPLLLYLHGGPGDAALPLIMKYNRTLEEHFTVVIWEQRGAGKSYYKFNGTVTIEDFIHDLLVLTQGLLSRFHHPNLFLLSHSWGSVLGLRFVHGVALCSAVPRFSTGIYRVRTGCKYEEILPNCL